MVRAKMNSHLLRSAAIVLSCNAAFTSVAHAQISENASGSEDVVSEDIVVTATRTSESINRVPLSISAFSQETLDMKSVRTIADVARFTPGVKFSTYDNKVTIRGISSSAGAGTTGIYVDETPIQMRNLRYASDDAIPAVFDLERIEILRGPQGTLFGAGSQGGTVRYITPQPSLDEYSAYARAELSTTRHGGESYEFGAAFGGPIVTDVLGFRISGYHRRNGGWVDRVDYRTGDITDRNTNVTKTTTLAASLGWQAGDNLLITPSFRYQKRTLSDNPEYIKALSDAGDGVFLNSSPDQRKGNERFYMPALLVELSTDNFDVISNSSYFKRNNLAGGYDGTAYNLQFYEYLIGRPFCDATCNRDILPIVTPEGIRPDLPYFLSPSELKNVQKTFTQELRIQSSDPNARLSWVVGAFYQNSKQTSIELLYNPNPNTIFPLLFGMPYEDFFGPLYRGALDYFSDIRGKDEQLAGFASFTYEVVEGLKLTAGMRYASTKFSFTNVGDGPLNGGPSSAVGSSKDKPFAPRLNATYELDQDNLVYATWSKGFRSGGANASLPSICDADLENIGITGSPDSYKSDKVSSMEVGSKNKFLDGRVTVAANVFNIDWTDIQQTVNLPGCGLVFVTNLGKARSRGFDLEATIRPFEGLSLDLAVGYVDTRYTRDVNSSPTTIIVAKDNAIDGSPWTVAIGMQYDFDIGPNQAYLRGDYQYSSHLDRLTAETDPSTASYDPYTVLPSATHFVGLRTGAEFEGVNASIFVDNLFDTAPRLRTFNWGATVNEVTWRPRTIGLTVAYRY